MVYYRHIENYIENYWGKILFLLALEYNGWSITKDMKRIVVLYHADCPDGFGAAWAAWKKFKNKADYIAVEHQMPLPKGLKNKEIYIFDFSYSPTIFKKLIKNNKKLVVIDHHISAAADVKSVPFHVYSPNHSGAVLAWKYFHSRQFLPRILKYIEDVDLWHFKIPQTREVFAALTSFDYNFKKWDKFAVDLEKPVWRKQKIAIGKIILQNENKLIEKIIKNAQLVKISGYKTLAVNSPIFDSEIGHALAKKFPPMGIVWFVKNGRRKFSLRSDGKVDVSEIAKCFGGGGHKAAAGFTLDSKKPFPWKVLKNSYE
ncbi:phosphohydrolase [Candidatus Jorgensenbacteria bacterium CG_4_10_14_0_8_um_filter_39_13]|uniref:Phosphohydrolase n=2 Tax=Candidatus Joergenseniibacteriota TaxID=1752739 RepID=A0A2M7RIQ8_9BACT|nr:MAG: phosphohydrolase [Candidatus Jorgensenbacteria bacterium CG11_big_fil_rev_8_21_14_0_20_38_23]PIV12997.1 MAG: phosphohydrolase [Candidatus Jorgensenbacteria bacterium CG03_land_8_20_14_0_80_38_39]PIW97895.1 MAG: phosphohydrolase [Candidatus Jorgensenbacteria bacterium CG_4_8_14_3_um_filter_38_10]PIY96639.1 MAG: phosphohydrolase [Candidatus Jorgensenbacteria bacterium CG_4_10_14_0_8_um_filter_39_13]PJA95200.1 MAG: phosphohydrolase [Candidatus Jorgensenbacteria bacterium CG_4_9_14_3_um_fil